MGNPLYQGDSQDVILAMNPFSLGPRGCAGKAMAYNQITLTMARLTWEFDFKPAEGDLGLVGAGDPSSTNGRHRVNEYQLKANVTSQSDGPVLIFRARA